MNHFAQEFEQALLSLNRLKAKDLLLQACHIMTPHQAADTIITPTLEHMGVTWERGEIALSQVYMGGKICEDLAATIFPGDLSSRKPSAPLAIAVLQDYHVLGKRIVCSALHAGGYEFLDYGNGITVEQLVQRTLQDNIRILLISTLMLPAAYCVQKVSQALKEVGSDVRIIVGGAPFRFDDQLWKEVGATAMGRSATDSLTIIAQMMAQM